MTTPAGRPWRPFLRMIGGWVAVIGVGLIAVVALSLIYVALPEPDVNISTFDMIVGASLVLVCYVGMILGAVVRLQRSRRPVQEGSIIITTLAAVIVLGYSWIYLALVASDAGHFSEPLTKASSVYFTVTVLVTVGFGDIVAVSDTARMVVTSQMLLGITLITLGIRLIMQSARIAAQRRGTLMALHEPQQPDDPSI